MIYDNPYNRSIGRQLHEIAQRHINHAKIVGGAILGGVVHDCSDTDSNYSENLEGGNGFAAGTHLDTGFGPTLGASPVDKITNAAVAEAVKKADGGAKYKLNTAHQTLMGGPQQGLGKPHVEAKGFWDDFSTGFKQGFNGVMDVAKPLIPLLAAAGKEKEGGAKEWHALKDKNELPSSSMGGSKENMANVLAEANPAFNSASAPVYAATHDTSLSYAHGAGAFDKVKAALKYLKDYAVRKAKNIEPSDFMDLSKEKIFLKIAKELVNELPGFVDTVKGAGKRAALRKHLRSTEEGRGLLDTVAPLLKFAPILLGLGKHKGKMGKGFLSDLISDIGLGKKKARAVKGRAAFDQGANDEIENLPKAQGLPEKKKRARKAVGGAILGGTELGKDKDIALDKSNVGSQKGLFLPQEVLTKKGGKKGEKKAKKGKKEEGKGIISDVLSDIGLGKKEDKEEKKEEEAEGGKRKASPWALLVKKVMADQKMTKMSDAIAYIKEKNLYKKNK